MKTRETMFWLAAGALCALLALALPRVVGAQTTGGSFGGSAWGSGGGSSQRQRTRPSNSGFGSGYDYNSNRYRSRTRYNSGGGGGSCATSVGLITAGLLGAVVMSGRRKR